MAQIYEKPEKKNDPVVERLLTQRRVLVQDRIDAKVLDRVTRELVHLECQEVAPITLIIESSGGETVPSLQFEDAIKMLHSPVDTLAIGDSASAAVDIMQMCRKRMMLPTARLLVHYMRTQCTWITDDMETLEKEVRYYLESVKKISASRMEMYKRRTGFSEEKIREMFRAGETHKAFYTAEQALELKLIDEIVTDFKVFPPPTETK